MRRRHRLRTDAQFKRVRSTGRSWANPLVVLYALANDEGVTRVGFSVGKRIGKAVERNRVKRLLREVVRLHLPRIKPGYDLILIARAPCATASYRDVAAAVDQLLRRSQLESPRESSEADLLPQQNRRGGEQESS